MPFLIYNIDNVNRPKKKYSKVWGVPGGTVVKNPLGNAGDTRDTGLIPGLGRSTEEGNGNLLQYSCLEIFMGRRARWATVHGAQRVASNSD